VVYTLEEFLKYRFGIVLKKAANGNWGPIKGLEGYGTMDQREPQEEIP
jgi:hypothetical protein